MSGSEHSPLAQLRQREKFERNGLEPWTTVYQRWRDGRSNGGQFAAFAPKSRRSEVLATDNWDVHWGFGLPVFFDYPEGQSPTYHRYGDHRGFEPLVILQDHFDIRPSMMPQLSEEFRLYHNLWVNENSTAMYKIESDGREELVVEISENAMRVRTNLLRHFQAGRQLDLVLYVDSVVIVEDDSEPASTIPIQTDLSGEFRRLTLSRSPERTSSSGSFLLGKKILLAPEMANAGVRPWSDGPEEHVHFVIGEDEHGDPIESTCDPAKLGNSAEVDPDAPHYITPVYFEKEVLQKYYNNSRKYSVGDGSIFCGSLWGMRLDNNHPKYVVVMLGDLGTYIPRSECQHWRQYNIVASGGVSKTAWTRWFMSSPINPEASDLRFKLAYRQFRTYWKEEVGWDFYKDLAAEDIHTIQSLRIPVHNNESEFENQLIYLSKLLIDSLNERMIQQELGTKIAEEKGIDKLERWMERVEYPLSDRDIAFLRRLQTLRSKLGAHRKGSDYSKTLQRLGVDSDRGSEIGKICSAATTMLQDLAEYFNVDSRQI